MTYSAKKVRDYTKDGKAKHQELLFSSKATWQLLRVADGVTEGAV